MHKLDQAEQLREITKHFALRMIHLFRNLPKAGEARVIGKQLLPAATSVVANYRAACRGRSNAEFSAKKSIAGEEAYEAVFRIELWRNSSIIKAGRLIDLPKEAMEILKIMAKSRKNRRKESQITKSLNHPITQ